MDTDGRPEVHRSEAAPADAPAGGLRQPIVPTDDRAPDPEPQDRPLSGPAVQLEGLRAFYGDSEQLKGIDLEFRANEVTAIIGPSGCGKSTLIRCINRMHEEIPGARAEGRVMLEGADVYDPSVDVVAVRRAIGMVFQKPNPFPTMSIFDNVAAGLRLTSRNAATNWTRRSSGRCAAPACGRRSRTASASRGSDSRAASSSGCASPARWPWTPR